MKKITKSNIAEFLSIDEARRLLKQFIINELQDEEDNLTLKYLRMYEESVAFTTNPKRDEKALRDCERALDDIEYGYPNEPLEKMVKAAFRTRNIDKVYDSLKDLQTELQYQIELSDELEQLKEKLLAKVDVLLKDKP